LEGLLKLKNGDDATISDEQGGILAVSPWPNRQSAL